MIIISYNTIDKTAKVSIYHEKDGRLVEEYEYKNITSIVFKNISKLRYSLGVEHKITTFIVDGKPRYKVLDHTLQVGE